jgi:hypothetical protein
MIFFCRTVTLCGDCGEFATPPLPWPEGLPGSRAAWASGWMMPAARPAWSSSGWHPGWREKRGGEGRSVSFSVFNTRRAPAQHQHQHQRSTSTSISAASAQHHRSISAASAQHQRSTRHSTRLPRTPYRTTYLPGWQKAHSEREWSFRRRPKAEGRFFLPWELCCRMCFGSLWRE